MVAALVLLCLACAGSWYFLARLAQAVKHLQSENVVLSELVEGQGQLLTTLRNEYEKHEREQLQAAWENRVKRTN
jgi:hypothetical protein